MDIVATISNGAPSNIDPTITTLRDIHIPPSWPSDTQVANAIAAINPLTAPTPIFFWEDHSEEKPHPEVVKARMFRTLATSSSIGKAFTVSERTKYQRYGNNERNIQVTPFVLTAGGGISPISRELVDTLTVLSNDDIREQVDFRRYLMGRLSIILIKYASFMFVNQAMKAFAGFDVGVGD